MTKAQAGESAVRRAPARSHSWAAVVFALTAAIAFGAIDQYVGALRSSFLTEVSGMSAPWLLLPFLAGAAQAGQRRAALVGLLATWLSVLAYVAMIVSPMEGTHLGPRPAGLIGTWNQLSPRLVLATLASQWLWFAGGLIIGPVYGWLGYRWRARRSRVAALLAVLPPLLEPAARWLVTRLGAVHASWLNFRWPVYGAAVVAEIIELTVGLVLTGVVVTAMARTRAAGTDNGRTTAIS
jgi:hypothetical protein